jgi:hypothetical protein
VWMACDVYCRHIFGTPFLSWGSSGKIFGVSFTMWWIRFSTQPLSWAYGPWSQFRWIVCPLDLNHLYFCLCFHPMRRPSDHLRSHPSGQDTPKTDILRANESCNASGITGRKQQRKRRFVAALVDHLLSVWLLRKRLKVNRSSKHRASPTTNSGPENPPKTVWRLIFTSVVYLVALRVCCARHKIRKYKED